MLGSTSPARRDASRRLGVSVLAALLPLTVAGLALAAPASAGPPTAVPVSCEAVLVDTGVGDAFGAGHTYHLRAWTGTYQSVGSDLCDGMTYVLPSHVEVTPGAGAVQGHDQYVLDKVDGGWIGDYVQQWAYPDANTYGREVAHGYGALAGWQLRTLLVERLDGSIIETGYAFPPAS